MAKGRINKTNVDAQEPGTSELMLWDDRISGFGLKVTPAGAKSYLFQYRLGGRAGRTRRYSIGKHGPITAEKARKEAERLSALVRQGIDPQQEKQDSGRRAVDLAFKSYVTRFVDDCLKVRWKASHKDGEALLKRYAIPVLGAKPLHEITRADIRAVLKPASGKVATARNLFAVLRRLFRWAVNEGDIATSPLTGMEPPPLPTSRDRVLSDREIRLVWKATDKLGYRFGPLIRLLLITGQRLEEVSGLPWSELDRRNYTWALPAVRAKNENASDIHLSELAFTEFEALAKRVKHKDGWPKRGLIFSTTGKTPVSGHSRAKRRLDREIALLLKEDKGSPEMEKWRFHDLRRTLATGLQRLGVRFEVTEAILNHVSGSKSGVAGVYQRHEWHDEKKTALNAWSVHLHRVVNSTEQASAEPASNVVPLVKAS